MNKREELLCKKAEAFDKISELYDEMSVTPHDEELYKFERELLEILIEVEDFEAELNNEIEK
jgi:hypothetical protein